MPWIVAAIAVGALLVGAAAVWLWFAAAPQRIPTIEIEEFAEAPELPTWAVETPWGSVAPDDICEAGQDAALLIIRDAADDPVAVWMLDTATGEIAWESPTPSGLDDAACAVASLDRAAAVLTTIDAQRRPGVLSIDLADGTITRPPGHLELLLTPEHLDGDIIASTGTSVGRYDLEGLVAVWTVESTGASVAAGSTVLVLDRQVRSLVDGSIASWSAVTGAYGGVDGALMRVDRDGSLATITAVDEGSGRDRWSRELGAGSAIPIEGSGLLLVTDAEAGTIAAVGVGDGGERWSIDASLDADPGAIVGSADAGLVLLPITGDPSTLAVLDLGSGDRRFDLSVGDPANPSPVVAMTRQTITVADPGGASLVAFDASTGEVRWRLETEPPVGRFLLVGGRFIALDGDAVLGVGHDAR
jgi:outer membrane protein assembly factor BamB